MSDGSARHHDDIAGLRRRPGPAPRLHRDALVEAAVAIADADGLDAVSMATVARRLGFSTMALYRHVASKAELVAAAVDVAIGPCSVPESRHWEDGLRAWSRSCLAVFERHPWLILATAAPGRRMGPHEQGWLDTALGIIAAQDLDPDHARWFVFALLGQVRLSAQFPTVTTQPHDSHGSDAVSFGVDWLIGGLRAQLGS